MRKKTPPPPLTIVGPSTVNPLAPPATLGKAGAHLWRTIMTEYARTAAVGKYCSSLLPRQIVPPSARSLSRAMD